MNGDALAMIIHFAPALTTGIVTLKRSRDGWYAATPWSGAVTGAHPIAVINQAFLPKGTFGDTELLDLFTEMRRFETVEIERRADGLVRITVRNAVRGCSAWPNMDGEELSPENLDAHYHAKRLELYPLGPELERTIDFAARWARSKCSTCGGLGTVEREQPGYVVRVPIELDTPAPLPDADRDRLRVDLARRIEAVPDAERTIERMQQVLGEVLAELGIPQPSKFGEPFIAVDAPPACKTCGVESAGHWVSAQDHLDDYELQLLSGWCRRWLRQQRRIAGDPGPQEWAPAIEAHVEKLAGVLRIEPGLARELAIPPARIDVDPSQVTLKVGGLVLPIGALGSSEFVETSPRPVFFPCGCSRKKVDLGRCDAYKPGESP